MEVVLLASCLNTLLPRLWDNRKDSHKRKAAIDINIKAIKRHTKSLYAALEDPKFKGDGSGSHLKREARELSQEARDCIQLFFINNKASSTEEFAIKLEKYSQDIKDLGKDVREHSSGETASQKPEDRLVNEPMGMDGSLAELMELVRLPGKPSEGRRKVISIVGFAGAGKTLLAKRVHDRSSGFRARVTAAARHAREVLMEILNKVDPGGNHGNLNLENLGQVIRQHLRAKRYLIVIDDMQSMEQWDGMSGAFPKDGDGDGTIIVTTTIQSVANDCSSCKGYVYNLSPLNADKSLDLFLENRTSWDRGLAEKYASDVLKKCDGLRLAIVSMSKIVQVHGGLTSDACKTVCTGLGADLVKEGGNLERLRWVLMNKYTGLTGDPLRCCLLYFCMYKHNMDSVPRKNSMIRRWEAEGFLLEGNRSCPPTDVAAKYLNTLVDRNIIQSMEVGITGSPRRCRPPGMMVEYISHISMSENFAASLSNAEAPRKIRRLSFHGGSAADQRKISGMDLSKVLTLVFSGKGCSTILNFKKYELIAVLDLKECTNLDDDHVKHICKLLLLKYLSLGDSIGEIPREVGQLVQLETLEMRTKETVKVYAEVLELPNLKHLLGKFELRHYPDVKLKSFLKEKSGLETITGFVTDTARGFPQLMLHMKRLRKVKIYCTPNANKTDQKDLQTEIKVFTRESTDAMGMGYDRSLSIDFTEFNDNRKGPLGFLQESGSLSSLKLSGDWRGFLGANPDFTKISGITKLCLSRTYLCGNDVLAGLTSLNALEYLKMDEEDLGPLTIKSETFQSLRRLFLVGETSLHGITIQPGAVPNLIWLHLICKALEPGLQSLIGIGSVTSLDEIALDSLVDTDIKDAWKTAAKDHPNRPHVLLIQKGAPIRQA